MFDDVENEDAGGDPHPVDLVSGRELGERLRGLDRELRVLTAEMTGLVRDALVSGEYRCDGHASIRQWVRSWSNWSDPHLARIIRGARLAHDHPKAFETLAAGGIGVDEYDTLAAVARNPRCGHQLADVLDLFCGLADQVSHRQFELAVRRWETLADLDGAHREAVDGHDGRNASWADLPDGSLTVNATFGPAQAAAVREILDRAANAQWHADWDDATSRLGANPLKEQLARTDTQRRCDALFQLLGQAIATPPGSTVPDPLVNLICDLPTFLRALQLLGPDGVDGIGIPGLGSVGTLDALDELLSQRNPLLQHANTIDGRPIPLADLLVAIISGKVRTVLTDPAGVTTHAGRTRRLFTGAQRDLVLTAALHCVYRGCDRPASNCQADHLQGWGRDGPSDLDNAAPTCAFHNRWRTRGYHLHRDAAGHWHTTRPDGTTL